MMRFRCAGWIAVLAAISGCHATRTGPETTPTVRLGLEDAVPDRSIFSKNRHGRFRESEAFRHVFEAVLQRCMAEGLVGGEGFAVDASVVKADASRGRRVSGGSLKFWSANVPRAQCVNTSKGSMMRASQARARASP